MAYQQQHLVHGGVFANFFHGLRSRIEHRLAQRAETARVYRELASMSDRELKDIGIAPGSIGDIAREAGAAI
ncbi:DUF1127 domain-containing protein [Celeribacter litoreus]|uniref:DUF1127 domain-containing protein n=1 Tax=Celeribacter litoreus TaxID=2876714 RepID=UPI001CCFF7C5|nr:DUF1127 domain-containing protein [Celeribacter litoreus]MCA0043714.1 DUF1127 domain-containing protein [Celeribacter litoreus]